MILVNRRDKVKWHEGMTVRDVLAAMGYNYILITVSVNEVMVPDEDYDTFPVPDEADVDVFHLAHGG